MCSVRKRVLLLLAIGVTAVMNQNCGSSAPKPQVQPPPTSIPNVTLASFASGLTGPVGLVPVNDGTGRLLAVEQRGTIRVIQNGTVSSTLFLDIQSKVATGGEMGLLGLALHPQYSLNGRFFVDYTRVVSGQRQSVIAEYTAAAPSANQVDATSERILLVIDQPAFDNHKGGQLAFGPDNFLYIGLGDGGGGGDPTGNGQKLTTMLGKILRIDVDTSGGGKAYGIPSTNPFGPGGTLPEIWAYGLRNPWRFSFDSSGRLFCADVGQNQWEEIDIIQRGGNYGWNTMEGAHCFSPSSGCNQAGLTLPISEYDHSEGTAVIGGHTYSGSAIPQLQGAYIFGDFSSGRIWMLREFPAGTWTRMLLLSSPHSISSFGQDLSGEVYVLDYGAGTIFKLTAQ